MGTIPTKSTTTTSAVAQKETALDIIESAIAEEPTTFVYDAGIGNTFSVSDYAFINGLFITSDPTAIQILDKFIEDTKAPWSKEVLDSTNPRHMIAQAKVMPVVTGTMDTMSLMQNAQSNMLANAIISGGQLSTATDEIKAAQLAALQLQDIGAEKDSGAAT